MRGMSGVIWGSYTLGNLLSPCGLSKGKSVAFVGGVTSLQPVSPHHDGDHVDEPAPGRPLAACFHLDLLEIASMTLFQTQGRLDLQRASALVLPVFSVSVLVSVSS